MTVFPSNINYLITICKNQLFKNKKIPIRILLLPCERFLILKHILQSYNGYVSS